MQTHLHDVAIFAIMQVSPICIVRLLLKELDYTVLRFALTIANIGIKAPPLQQIMLLDVIIYSLQHILIFLGHVPWIEP